MQTVLIFGVTFIIVYVLIAVVGDAIESVRENKREEKRQARELKITIEKQAQEANDIAEGLYKPW